MTSRRAILILVCAAWMVSTGGLALYSVLRSDDPFGYKALQLPVVVVTLGLGFALARVGRFVRSEVSRLGPPGSDRRGSAGASRSGPVRGGAAGARRGGSRGRPR